LAETYKDYPELVFYGYWVVESFISVNNIPSTKPLKPFNPSESDAILKHWTDRGFKAGFSKFLLLLLIFIVH